MRGVALKANVMADGDDRFERRLVEETSRVRVEVAGVEVRLTDRIAQAEAALWQEAASLEVRLTGRIAQAEAALRQEISGVEVRLLKWSFAFWIGQVIALTAIMKALLA